MVESCERFWALGEMQLEVARYLDPADFRKLVCTSRANYHRFLADAWRVVVGVGNLLAILHKDLEVRGTGEGRPQVDIPLVNQLEEYRISRFLMHAELVERLKVNSNPNQFVNWRHLERLLDLPMGPNRGVIMPGVTHFSIKVARRYRRVEAAPFIRLMANNRLQQIWIAPNRSQIYPRSTLTDAEGVFEALTDAFGDEHPLQWLSFYPESVQDEGPRRDAMIQQFLPLSRSLRFLNMTIWFLSIPLLLTLSQAPLERFEIQGRAPVPYVDMSLLGQIQFPEGAFTNLRLLFLQDVPLGFASQLFLAQPLINNVEILRLELCNIDEVEEDPDVLYLAIFQRLAAFPNLREFTFTSNRTEFGQPYPLTMDLLRPLLQKRLNVLRLFRVGITESNGFESLRYVERDVWENLTLLCIMHQDITPEDLFCLAQLPNIVELGANIGVPLGARHHGSRTTGFSQFIVFSSQYRFRARYNPGYDQRIVERICMVLDTVTPNGMTVLIDRLFVREDQTDERDAVWIRKIMRMLEDLGKTIPRNIEWVASVTSR
ncbi:hypothetical protein FRC11_001582 [Ceratobasidium sp. 423]|nr:hypothetical protein FRC11_001582 [Ceratobasidium sp. 423]